MERVVGEATRVLPRYTERMNDQNTEAAINGTALLIFSDFV
jgi:hypothetical protein